MTTNLLSAISFRALLVALTLSLLAAAPAAASGGVEDSYHGQMGFGTDTGMLEKWCALPNFSFSQQGGVDGWASQSCNACHIGAYWNPTKPEAQCNLCHTSAIPVGNDVTIAGCVNCHKKDTAKRGDVFTAEEDVHIAAGFLCQDCHLRVTDSMSDHQFLKGTAIDTTESTMEATMSCRMAGCHEAVPHRPNVKGRNLDKHIAKVACETCHTGLRPGSALASRQWNVFSPEGVVKTTKRAPGWLPEHKWYDNTGPGASGNYDLPILGYTERRNVEGAKIYPFNAVSVDWFVKERKSDFDDVIIVPEVKAADANADGTVTTEEMRVTHRTATLKSADMNFSISHSVVPKKLAFDCNDCHGRNGWVLDWKQLGYKSDPRGNGSRKRRKGQ